MHPAHIDQLRLQIEELRRALPEIDADEDLREDMLEGCTDYKEVIEKLVYIERITKTMIDGTEIYIDKMQKRKRNLIGKWQGVRDIISSVMESANLRKVDLVSATVTIAKTGRSVQILDASLIPDELCRIKKEPDKIAIKDALFAGETVPGAMLNNGGEALRIS
jgi:hypothetical protein